MAIIYGGIQNQYSKNFNDNLFSIQNNLNWVGAQFHEVNYKDFKGRILIHENHPYSPTHYYAIDKSVDTLVLFSGTLYNKVDLLSKFKLADDTMSTANLILCAYKTWGEQFVSKLNGDFAIVIYDFAKSALYFYRDHVGVQPLAYTKKGGDYFFSSDAIALCKSLYKDVDKGYLLKWLSGAYGMYSILPSNRVQKIKPGHYLSISANSLKENKYWFPEKIKIDKHLTLDTVKSEITALLQRAVSTRADKRFFASAHLSGGLDSSIVASLAKKEYAQQKDFYGFSWSAAEEGTENISFDERQLVKDTCELTGIKEVPFFITDKDYKEYEDDWRIATYLYEEVKTRKDAQNLGVNLIFSGWGGDEFISINNRGIDADLFFNLQWAALLKKHRTYNPISLVKRLLVNVLIPVFYPQLYLRDSENFNIQRYFHLSRSERRKVNYYPMSYKSRQEVHLKLFKENHLADRTEDWAVNGSRKGIEYRYPLLDKDIIEYILKVPSRLLYKDGYRRIILREISEGLLPESVRWHRSKFDEVKFAGEKKLLDGYCKTIMDNPIKMESNPLLNFINFKVLFKDTRNAFEKGDMNYSGTHCRTVLYIKKMHKFIEAYKS
ncbi:asparagine synthase-related protein [Aequorivita sediminis]|uniref:asparagine synthase-related protein n=1 Tax=Aequorivita sediminis TaxID=3073653 RepID=UPI0028A5AB3A|nr:asparagine synthase-related protein [Aequorivita sp. F6058]